MAYVAIKGGEAAIEQSLVLLDSFHSAKNSLEVQDVVENFPYLIDQIMSEAGLYAPLYAALSLKQSKGSLEEAIFLMRAYRSTLTREYYSLPVRTENMRIFRRISASFKDIPGGQILGPTFDYSHRLLDFGLLEESLKKSEDTVEDFVVADDIYCQRVRELLQKEGLFPEVEDDNTEPFDVTSNLLTFPADRSARLQTLTRSDTGFLGGIAYSHLRGYGSVHATVGELRAGMVSVEIEHPLMEGETICIGEIYVTEVDAFCPSHEETSGEFDKIVFSGGYGCVFGRNETKAISMSIVDSTLNEAKEGDLLDDEFVLTHGSSLEMNGFISHLKLPHYVTFQSNLDLVRGKEEKDD